MRRGLSRQRPGGAPLAHRQGIGPQDVPPHIHGQARHQAAGVHQRVKIQRELRHQRAAQPAHVELVGELEEGDQVAGVQRAQ
jgi:hypothetical protein